MSDLEADQEVYQGKVTVKGFATIDAVTLISVEVGPGGLIPPSGGAEGGRVKVAAWGCRSRCARLGWWAKSEQHSGCHQHERGCGDWAVSDAARRRAQCVLDA